VAERDKHRPSPDALLRAAQRSERGRLKIFLGAAPGVGKTYEMLSAAQARRREGVDVAVGIVETHGRKETEALLADLPAVPRRQIEYRGRFLEEMDIDAILARRPRLVLVDELAHANAPGSRHPKRFMDVEELLAAGIDVYTTVNIQHVESLNDVVTRITRIRVRETVPDSVVDRADEIALIDLTPEDLIQRLRDGKVYIPHQAVRAVQHYFKPGNLTALRELALRRTAQRVDEQMLDYMRSHAIEGPWAAGERVMVCVEAGANAIAIVRHAKRLADQLKAPWLALNVETPRALRGDETERNQVAAAMRLAQPLGAEAVLLPGQDVAETIVDYARANNVTHLIIGKPRRPRWSQLLFGSVAQQLIGRAGGLNVHIIEAPAEAGRPRGSEPAVAGERPGVEFGAYLVGALLIIAALPPAFALRQFLAVSNIALVFLTAVTISAVMYGLLPSLFACLLGVLAYNFFFLPPIYTFTIADPENVVALFFFAIVAIIVSNLAARVRSGDRGTPARQSSRAALPVQPQARGCGEDGGSAVGDRVSDCAHAEGARGDPAAGRRGHRGEGRFPPEDMLDEADLAAARWCWEKNRPAGRESDTLPGAKWLFLPLRTARQPVGLVGVVRDQPGPLLRPDQRRLLDALADQAALAIERINLAQDLDEARVLAEADKLRPALLTSISHDLRTPLASILGSASSLTSQGAGLDQATSRALLTDIQDEAERLNRFIGNLLDMTRLESGALQASTTRADLADLVGAALRRAGKILSEHRVELDLPRDLPMLDLDMVLFEQVLFNLLDNGAKYSPRVR
jgi:two-component system sensor histidine kinase KdpD